jgi:chromosomal replication initiation ATPase DnaA
MISEVNDEDLVTVKTEKKFKNPYDVLALGFVVLKGKPNPRKVLRKACKHFDISEHELTKQCRETELVERRAMVCGYMYDNVRITYKAIGEIMGNRDYSTIINSVQNHRDWCEVDKGYAARYSLMATAIQNSL